MSLGLFRLLHFSLFLVLSGLFLGSCQNLGEQDSTTLSAKYYLEREQLSQPQEILQKLDSFDDWTRKDFNKMAQKHGNVWFHLDLPPTEIPRVLEFQTLNLIEFQAFLIKEDGELRALTPSKMPFSQNYSFQLESSGRSVLILLKQQWGGIIRGFELLSLQAYEDQQLLRVLVTGMVIGLFLLSFLLTALVGWSQNQLWLLVIIVNGLFGVLLEKKLYLLLGFSFTSEVYLKLFAAQLAINSIAYLRIIVGETGFKHIKFQNYLQHSLTALVVFFLTTGFLAFEQKTLLKLFSNPFQLNVLGFILVYFYCVMVLVISWKKRPHLHEFAILFIVIYSLPLLTNLTVEGTLPQIFDLWNADYRAVIPLILSIILYKDRELRLRRLTSQLEIQNRNKDLFLARTSHELRTPLAGMIGLCESILERKEGLAGAFVRKLEIAVNSGRRMNQLIGDITDFTNMRDGKLKLERHPANFAQIFQTMLPLVAPSIERKALSLKTKIPENLPKVDVDENRIQQVLFNLINNAVKYTQSGEILMEARLLGSSLQVEVRDTGVGVPEDELDKIFKDYGRGSNVATISGMGLGLSLSRHIVELHQGEMQISSQLGAGTRVQFTLPLAEGLPSQEASPQASQERLEDDDFQEVAESEKGVSFEGRARIVVVDDEPLNVEIIHNFLEFLDLEITSYADGNSMLERLTEDDPDLLILDLMMPDLDGYSVIRQVRSEYSPQELPILVVTANEQERTTHKSLTLGANDYLIKPLVAMELRSRVQSQLGLIQQIRLQKSLEESEKQRIELHQEHHRMATLFDTVDTPLVVTSSADQILYANKSFGERTGFPQSETLQRSISSFFQQDGWKNEKPSVSRQIILQKDGTEWPCQLTVRAMEFGEQQEWVYTVTACPESEQPETTVTPAEMPREQAVPVITSMESARANLVELLDLAVKYFRLATGESTAELARRSEYWHITMNGSTPRAYMLERYLDLTRLPKKPKWGLVFRTCDWVLRECEEQQPLKQEILQRKQLIEERISETAYPGDQLRLS